jgi:hypothetical protein
MTKTPAGNRVALLLLGLGVAGKIDYRLLKIDDLAVC